MKNFTIKPVMRERIGILIKFIEQKVSIGETLTLKRRDIAEIVGVSEGDSLKAIIKILKEYPEEYDQKITLDIQKDKNVTLYTFGIADANVFVAATSQSSITISPVIVKNGKIVGLITGRELVTLWKEQGITYNPIIQRGTKQVKKNGVIEEVAVCSEMNIVEIANKMASNDYCCDTITLNISNCEYSIVGKELVINKTSKDSEVNVLDGQHRNKGLLLVDQMIQEGKDVKCNLEDMVFPLQIETLEIEKAQNAFSQFTKGLKISTTRREFFDNNNPYTIFAKDLVVKSRYADKVETVKDNIKSTDKLVSFGNITNGLKNILKIEQLTDDLKDYMIQFLNILEGIMERTPNDKNSMLKENITYYGYFAMAAKMFNKNIPLSEERVSNLIKSIDMNKGSDLWLGKVTLQGKTGLNVTNKKDTRKYVSNLFASLV